MPFFKHFSIYIIVLFFALTLFFYLFYLKDPNIHQNLARQTLYFNYYALQNGIRLSNIKFLAQAEKKHINVIISNGIGLDFNDYGFPVGTRFEHRSANYKLKTSDCSEIWQFVLNKLGNRIQTTANKDEFWTESKSNSCFYYSPVYIDEFIVYNPLSGKVHLSSKINN
ncbi:MAG: hypothetical protein OEY19_03440 [Gammaproteobacteria bacterium]|nr:hypothetical protein [Gammaproteobacteria bacterium]MDH5628961.1 hypothetical protein [Gammaproteobacteria bacterium]